MHFDECIFYCCIDLSRFDILIVLINSKWLDSVCSDKFLVVIDHVFRDRPVEGDVVQFWNILVNDHIVNEMAEKVQRSDLPLSELLAGGVDKVRSDEAVSDASAGGVVDNSDKGTFVVRPSSLTVGVGTLMG
jgi:hypothetical protein